MPIWSCPSRYARRYDIKHVMNEDSLYKIKPTLHSNKRNKTVSAIFVSMMCFMLSEYLHS